MLVVALTGGIGSGKSTVADCFRQLGVDVIDADIVAREVVSAGNPALKAIALHFGNDVLDYDGSLDRQRLREIVFNNENERLWLERLTHPLIRQSIHDAINQCSGAYCIVEIPLFFETERDAIYDKVCVVDVPEALQIERASKRDDSRDIGAIMQAQVTRTHRLEHADFIIDNSGSLEATAEQVEQLHQQLVSSS